MLPEFVEFKPIPRLTRPCVITEKIDGTNGVVHVAEDGVVTAGSRSRWITPQMDNHGFAKWVADHADELRAGLGVGTHYGEWWGAGVNKRYPGVLPKRFSLFNVHRWRETRPACCDVVPVLYEGIFTTDAVENALMDLRINGSRVALDCKAEGVVVFHVQSRLMFKKTIEKDEEHKSQAAAATPSNVARPASSAEPAGAQGASGPRGAQEERG